MTDFSAPEAHDQIGRTFLALQRELEKVRLDLVSLRQKLRGAGAFDARKETFRLEQVGQWVSIAIDLETRLGQHIKIERSGKDRERSFDLGAARDSIGRKLDRLRAARDAGGLSERADG